MGLNPKNPFKRRWRVIELRLHVITMINERMAEWGESANGVIRRFLNASVEPQMNTSKPYTLRPGESHLSIIVSSNTHDKLEKLKWRYRWPIWKVVENVLENPFPGPGVVPMKSMKLVLDDDTMLRLLQHKKTKGECLDTTIRLRLGMPYDKRLQTVNNKPKYAGANATEISLSESVWYELEQRATANGISMIDVIKGVV